MAYSTKFTLLLLSLFLLIGACKEPVVVPESNKQMAALLDTIAQNALKNTSFPYFNSQLAKKYAARLVGIPYKIPIQARIMHIQELLLSGKNEVCIEECTKVIEAAFPDNKLNRSSKPYFRILAMAHLRHGEQLNCQNNHNAESCILPIAGKGIHTQKEPAQKAFEIYIKLMEYDSTDLQAKWFLNLSAMTLGKYPDGIPTRFVIPPSTFESESNIPRFQDIAMGHGLAVNGHAGGCSMEDFNGDGLLDIFATSYGLQDQCRLFYNDGKGSFYDATETAGLTGLVAGLNSNHVDYNNDGFMDIFIMRGGWLGNIGRIPNSLLKNNGDGTFTEATKEAGLLDFYPTQTSTWADFNNDGWIDLFVGNETTGRSFPCQLFINQKDGTFKNQAKEAGLEVQSYVKGVCSADFNNDNWPDLYISIIGNKNKLYISRGMKDGVLTFEDKSEEAGVTLPIFSFPTWSWDYNNDGFEDIFVSGYGGNGNPDIPTDVLASLEGKNYSSELPCLYKNNGDGTFTEVRKETKMDRLLYTMGCNFGDLDNDGWEDAYFGTGEFNMWASIPNRMFRNKGGIEFQDVTTAGGFGQLQKGHGISFGDLDNDGDQDIYTVTGGALEGDVYFNALFENPGNENQWINLTLEGVKSNRSAIGARIKIDLEDQDGTNRSIYKTVGTGASFGGNSLQVEVGLAQAKKINGIEVTWPISPVLKTNYSNLNLKQHYLLNEAEKEAQLLDKPAIKLSGGNTHHSH